MADLHPWWRTYIRAGAVKRGLDPAAVLAVASMEGLSGGVGDGGHAFGPFQMNDAGGVLTNRPGNHRAFAESRAGIDNALDAMAGYAKGLKGQRAIEAIVRQYERPANPGKEIAGATSAYGHLAGTPAPQVGATPGVTALGGGLGTDTLSQGVRSAQDGAAAIRAQARRNLSDIATGAKTATESLADIASTAQAMQPMTPTMPVIRPVGKGAPKEANQAVALAKKYLGYKYTWGGETPGAGFDCSGLLQYVWKSMGVSIPRVTYDQWAAGRPVSAKALKPGDAVFFTGSDPKDGKPGHVGMYIGGGRFIEAPGRGKEVRISTLAGRKDFVGARRFG